MSCTFSTTSTFNIDPTVPSRQCNDSRTGHYPQKDQIILYNRACDESFTLFISLSISEISNMSSQIY